MKRKARAFTSFVVVMTILSLTILEVGHLIPPAHATAAHASPAKAASGPCIAYKPIKPAVGGPVVRRRVRHLVACSVRTWPVPGGFPMAWCISGREAGPYRWPWSDSASSKGVFQQNAAYWDARARMWWERRWLPGAWPPNVFNARQNVIVSIRMAHAGGWGPWTTAGGC